MEPFGGEVRRTAHGRVLYDPARAAWLEAQGYLRPEGPGARAAREVFHRSERRENVRRSDGPGGTTLYEKRAWDLGLKEAVACRRAAGRRGSIFVREWTLLNHAGARGLRVPRPWAAGEVRGRWAPREGFLLVEELPGRSLAERIEALASASAEERIRCAEALGAAVAALHEAGIVFPELQAKHVWTTGEEALGEIGFLDLASASLVRSPSRAQRALDLGVLSASLPLALVPTALRLHFLCAYLARIRFRWRRKEAWLAVSLAASRRLRLRRYRENLATSRSAWAAVRTPEPGLQIVAGEDRVLLERFRDRRAGAPGWSEREGFLLLEAEESDAVRLTFRRLHLWRLFRIPSARPIGWMRASEERALAVFHPAPAEASSLPAWLKGSAGRPDALVELLLTTIRAGVLPARGFLHHVHVDAADRLCVAAPAPVRFPRRLRPRDLRAALIPTMRSLRELPLPPGESTRLNARLRREAPHLALVAPRPSGR